MLWLVWWREKWQSTSSNDRWRVSHQSNSWNILQLSMCSSWSWVWDKQRKSIFISTIPNEHKLEKVSFNDKSPTHQKVHTYLETIGNYQYSDWWQLNFQWTNYGSCKTRKRNNWTQNKKWDTCRERAAICPKRRKWG